MNGFIKQSFEAVLSNNYVSTEKKYLISFNNVCLNIFATTLRNTIDASTVYSLQVIDKSKTGFKGCLAYYKPNSYGFSGDNAMFECTGY